MISVCIATYNGERFLKEQLFSILSQLSDKDEVVISDDGSNDGTLKIVRDFKDQRIRILDNKGPHGVASNFENAIRHASGDYIFLSDQDDIWLSDKKEKCLSCLQECDFVSHNAFIADERGVPSGKDYFSLRGTRYGYWHNLWKMGYLGCCMAFRRECLRDILPFPKEILWHDVWIASVLHLKYKGRLLEDGLILYRRHGDNASPTTQKSQYSWYFKFQYRNYIFWNSLKRALQDPSLPIL